MKGIQLGEVPTETSYMADQDQADFTACPSLKYTHFDAEAVSPDALKGMEPPILKVMEDS